EDLNCFTIITKKLSIPILNQFTTDEKSRSIRSNIKPQYDEIMIPNWTYSTGLGLVYNPIREKNKKLIKRTIRNTTKDVDSMIKLNHNTSNEINLLNSTLPTSLISIDHSSKPVSYNNQQHIKNPNTQRNSSPYGYRCNNVFNKYTFDKRQFSQKIFICKVHSSSLSYDFHGSIAKNKTPYRMAYKQ
ncbi:unnamed protein product, partial [Adineta steineri]